MMTKRQSRKRRGVSGGREEARERRGREARRECEAQRETIQIVSRKYINI